MNGRDAADVAAVFTIFGSWVSLLPEIAALLAIIWTVIRIYEWARIRLFGRAPDAGSK